MQGAPKSIYHHRLKLKYKKLKINLNYLTIMISHEVLYQLHVYKDMCHISPNCANNREHCKMYTGLFYYLLGGVPYKFQITIGHKFFTICIYMPFKF